MAMTSAYTLIEAREMLDKWKACERALADGTAKHYRVGTREFTAIDLPEIAERIRTFAKLIEDLTKGARTNRTQYVIPRDI